MAIIFLVKVTYLLSERDDVTKRHRKNAHDLQQVMLYLGLKQTGPYSTSISGNNNKWVKEGGEEFTANSKCSGGGVMNNVPSSHRFSMFQASHSKCRSMLWIHGWDRP